MLNREISEADLNLCDALLEKFVILFEDYYGMELQNAYRCMYSYV